VRRVVRVVRVGLQSVRARRTPLEALRHRPRRARDSEGGNAETKADCSGRIDGDVWCGGPSTSAQPERRYSWPAAKVQGPHRRREVRRARIVLHKVVVRFGVYETLLEFNLLRTNAVSDRARNNQFAVISPTSHCRSEVGTTANTIVGERELGDAQLDCYTIFLQWFDFWLKGIDNGVTKRPKLMLYVMGRNQWRAENEWPLARTQYTKYYLHSDCHANSRWGSGGLSITTPKIEPTGRFTYDPRTPVPSRGGPLCCTGTPDAAEGSFDQSEVEARNDVLIYTTPELREGVEATGPIKAVLYASSSAKDTDFTVKLVDVYPEGRAFNVQEGILRARHREGFTKKVWMKAGEVYEPTAG
jgi:uncharacterized protein